MKEFKYAEITENPGKISLGEIPVLDYESFREQTIGLLKKDSYHCLNYFFRRNETNIEFYILIANDDSHRIIVYSHHQQSDVSSLMSITESCFQLHVFERDIYERTGIIFTNHPWLKPLRYPFNRSNKDLKISNHPFYTIKSDETHEVGVGPIHAGIIEPGHFRFLCHGERVLHLEIQLGYQHRGVEDLFVSKNNQLYRSALSESIAGDTAIGHGLAYTQLMEKLAGTQTPGNLKTERIVALEMERMAVHVGDTAALCGDIAFQLGQSACEALRTIIINTMQDWCGNRFGKGLVRACGTNYPLTAELAVSIRSRLAEVSRRFGEVADLIYNNSGVIARFENTGTVSALQASLAGGVGPAARASGINRDVRKSHPFQQYEEIAFKPVILQYGDVLARALIRKHEFDSSYSVINELLQNFRQGNEGRPDYNLELAGNMLGVSLVEGWRGEVCHTAITGNDNEIISYGIVDPSVHNWHLLALAVRNQEISDFPVCNKSFNLSYCGNDL